MRPYALEGTKREEAIVKVDLRYENNSDTPYNVIKSLRKSQERVLRNEKKRTRSQWRTKLKVIVKEQNFD